MRLLIDIAAALACAGCAAWVGYGKGRHAGQREGIRCAVETLRRTSVLARRRVTLDHRAAVQADALEVAAEALEGLA